MTQPPSFVIPRNRPLNPKSKSRPKVEAMQSLANVKCFTVYLNYLRLGLEIRDLLPLLPSIFASNHRLKRDERSADLQSLYDGTGGEVVDFGGLSSTCNTNTTLSGIATGVATDACVTAVTDVQEELPSYEAASSTGPREWTGFGMYLLPLTFINTARSLWVQLSTYQPPQRFQLKLTDGS